MGNSAMNYQKENGFFSIPTEENYHMNLDALKAFMPEKYRLLEELHEEIGGVFSKNSTPVYDVNTGKIYFSLGLDRDPQTNDYTALYIKVRNSLNNGTPVKGWKTTGKHLRYHHEGCFYEYLYDNVEGHIFMAIEDLPIKILKNAIKNQLKGFNKVDKKETDNINNFVNASRGLDQAIKEAKELLK